MKINHQIVLPFFQMTSRKVIVAILLVAISCSWFAISGFTLANYNTDEIEAFSSALLDCIPSELTEKELSLYINTDDHGHMDRFQILFNINDQPEYLLVESLHGGYSIYNRLTGTLLEKNEVSKSIFKAGKYNIYGGPMTYCEKNDQGILDIRLNRLLSKEEIQSVESMQMKVREDLVKKYYYSKKGSYSKSPSTTPVWNFEEDLPFSDITLNNFTNVAYATAIGSWTDVQQFGYNIMGTCQEVAATILLRYEDIRYAGVIPEEAPQSWHTVTDNVVYTYYDEYNQSNSSTFGINEIPNRYQSIPGRTYYFKYENVHRYLTAKVGKTNYLNSGVLDNDIVTALTSYAHEINLLGCLNISVQSIIYPSFGSTVQDVFSGIKIAINNGHPIAVSLLWNSSSSKGESSSNSQGTNEHKAVAYGYYEDTDNQENYVRLHFGWGTSYNDDEESFLSYSSVIVNQEYLRSYDARNFWLNTSINSANHVLSAITQSGTQTGLHTCNNSSCYACSATHEFAIRNNNYTHSCVCGLTEDHTDDGGPQAIYYDVNIYNDTQPGKNFFFNKNAPNSYALLYTPQLVHYCYCGQDLAHNYLDDHSFHQCVDCIYGEKPVVYHAYIQSSDKRSHFCGLLCGRNETCTPTDDAIGAYAKYYDNGVLSLNYHSQTCLYCNHLALFPHVKSYINNGNGTHTLYCAYCNLEHTTNHTYTVRQYNATQHVTKCNCGDGTVYANHTFKTYLIFFKKCSVCGYVK